MKSAQPTPSPFATARFEDNRARLGMGPVSLERLYGLPGQADFRGDAVGDAPVSPPPALSFYETANPALEAFEQVRDLIVPQPPPTLITLFGFGLGCHAEALEQRFPRLPILVLDPCPAAVRTTLLARTPELRNTVLCLDESDFLSVLRGKAFEASASTLPLVMPAYQRLFPGAFARYKELVRQESTRAGNAMATLRTRHPHWVDHTIRNLRRAATLPPVSCLGKRFSGLPGILAAAGPSLDQNIHQLAPAQGKALIVTVNHALAPLCRAGIQPDLVLVAESLDLRRQFDFPAVLSEVALVPALNAFPGFFDLPARHILPLPEGLDSAFIWYNQALGLAPTLSGGSVACSAFSLLHQLGCDPIILVGQDLAFTRGQSYASGATFGRRPVAWDPAAETIRVLEPNKEHDRLRQAQGLCLLNECEGFTVPAWGGDGAVVTNSLFHAFRLWFENAAQSWPPGPRLINATEGGSRIAGFAERPLRSVLAEFCRQPIPVRSLIDEAVRTAPPNDLAALEAAIQLERNQLRQAQSAADRAVRLAGEARQRLEEGQFQAAESLLAMLQAAEEDTAAASDANRLLRYTAFTAVSDLAAGAVEDLDPDPLRQTNRSLERSIRLFARIAETAETLSARLASLAESLAACGRRP